MCKLNKKESVGLTDAEHKERQVLLRVQKDGTRWFTQKEFDRLKELSNKMFEASKPPHYV